jgi:Zn-dependent protease with chaperone function
MAATMDFFSYQDRARRRTSLLVFFYVLAVAAIVAGIYFAFTAAFYGMEVRRGGDVGAYAWWDPKLFATVAAATLAVVLVGSLFKMSQLRQGGAAVATMLGGRLVQRNTAELAEKRLLNVVEEMSIASGTPVPPVYLLEGESGINAFAAGFTPSDAVIGVTRGSMEKLSREELQGVIAHEFSHILNGDMRLNIRLMGVLNGILVLAIIGYVVFRITLGTGSRRRSGRGKGGGGAMAIAAFGLMLMAIGYIGVFFSKLIKSAVSRQREYLADAAAVQFTRQPSGLAGALKKIGGLTGSRLASPHAQEASHFYFANGLRNSLIGLLATHPPLVARITRIDPQFDGEFGKAVAAAAPAAPAAAGLAGLAAGAGAVETGPEPQPQPKPKRKRKAKAVRFEASPEELAARVGAPKIEHLEHAGRLLASLPSELVRAAEDPFGARAVVYVLLLNTEKEPRHAQLKHLEAHADAAVYAETRALIKPADKVGPELRLPLIDLTIASLRQMSAAQYGAFVENVQKLIAADKRVELFEYVVSRMIRRHLAPTFHPTKPPTVKYHAINPLADRCGALLSCLAYYGAAQAESAAGAYENAIDRLGLKRPPAISPKAACGLNAVESALDALTYASPAIKRRLIEACTVCIAADGTVSAEEAELLRAIADALDCPVPPFLPGQQV